MNIELLRLQPLSNYTVIIITPLDYQVFHLFTKTEMDMRTKLFYPIFHLIAITSCAIAISSCNDEPSQESATVQLTLQEENDNCLCPFMDDNFSVITGRGTKKISVDHLKLLQLIAIEGMDKKVLVDIVNGKDNKSIKAEFPVSPNRLDEESVPEVSEIEISNKIESPWQKAQVYFCFSWIMGDKLNPKGCGPDSAYLAQTVSNINNFLGQELGIKENPKMISNNHISSDRYSIDDLRKLLFMLSQSDYSSPLNDTPPREIMKPLRPLTSTNIANIVVKPLYSDDKKHKTSKEASIAQYIEPKFIGPSEKDLKQFYPLEEKEKQNSGYAVVKFSITESANIDPKSVEVIASSNNNFKKAALDLVLANTGTFYEIPLRTKTKEGVKRIKVTFDLDTFSN